jgi:hypothetical protein
MNKVLRKVKEEFLEIIPPTIYFFVALHLVALIHKLTSAGTAISPLASVSIVVAALILGKAVLISNALPMINRFPEKPLIYNIAWKTVIYTVIATLLHYLENLAHFWKLAGSFSAANKRLRAEIVWPHFAAIEIILIVLVGIYCTTHEMSRLLGKGKLRRIFFGPMPIPQA